MLQVRLQTHVTASHWSHACTCEDASYKDEDGEACRALTRMPCSAAKYSARPDVAAGQREAECCSRLHMHSSNSTLKPSALWIVQRQRMACLWRVFRNTYHSICDHECLCLPVKECHLNIRRQSNFATEDLVDTKHVQ